MSELKKYLSEPSHQKIKLLDGRSIGIRKWLLGEEKDFLFNIESRRSQVEDSDTSITEKDVKIEEAIQLAKKCVDKPKMLDTMSSSNIVYLLSELRKISKGEKIEFTYHCNNPDCPDYIEFNEEQRKRFGVKGQSRTPFEGDINLSSEEIEVKRLNDAPIKIGGFKYHIRELPYSSEKELDEKYLKKLKLNEWNYNFVLDSIAAIEPEGEEKIEITDKDELSEFLDKKLSTSQFKDLSEKMAEQICGFSINKKVKCPLCQQEIDIIYDELFSLMVF